MSEKPCTIYSCEDVEALRRQIVAAESREQRALGEMIEERRKVEQLRLAHAKQLSEVRVERQAQARAEGRREMREEALAIAEGTRGDIAGAIRALPDEPTKGDSNG